MVYYPAPPDPNYYISNYNFPMYSDTGCCGAQFCNYGETDQGCQYIASAREASPHWQSAFKWAPPVFLVLGCDGTYTLVTFSSAS